MSLAIIACILFIIVVIGVGLYYGGVIKLKGECDCDAKEGLTDFDDESSFDESIPVSSTSVSSTPAAKPKKAAKKAPKKVAMKRLPIKRRQSSQVQPSVTEPEIEPEFEPEIEPEFEPEFEQEPIYELLDHEPYERIRDSGLYTSHRNLLHGDPQAASVETCKEACSADPECRANFVF